MSLISNAASRSAGLKMKKKLVVLQALAILFTVFQYGMRAAGREEGGNADRILSSIFQPYLTARLESVNFITHPVITGVLLMTGVVSFHMWNLYRAIIVGNMHIVTLQVVRIILLHVHISCTPGTTHFACLITELWRHKLISAVYRSV